MLVNNINTVVFNPLAKNKSELLFDSDPFILMDLLCTRRFKLVDDLSLLKMQLHGPCREHFLTDDWKFRATIWLIELESVQSIIDNLLFHFPSIFS